MAVYSSPVLVGVASPHGGQRAKRLINIIVQGVCSNWGGSMSGMSGMILYVPTPLSECVERDSVEVWSNKL